MKDTSIKEALQKGATEDELIQELKNQISEAHAEMELEDKKKEEEAQKAKTLAEARKQLMSASKTYLTQICDDVDDEDMKEMERLMNNLLDSLEECKITFSDESKDSFWPFGRHWLRHWFSMF